MGSVKTKYAPKIVCIGWGSLIWEPGDLPIEGKWRKDGPMLPVEFARQSAANHITLVIIEGNHLVPTLWAELNVNSLTEGVEALKVREDVPSASSIGRWPNATNKTYPFTDKIAEWAQSRGISGVVWTALQPGMKRNRGTVPTLEELTAHIEQLDRTALEKASTYIVKAPQQIITPYRRALAQTCAAVAEKLS